MKIQESFLVWIQASLLVQISYLYTKIIKLLKDEISSDISDVYNISFSIFAFDTILQMIQTSYILTVQPKNLID